MANIRSSRKSGFILRGGVRRRESLWVGGSAVAVVLSGPAVTSLTHVMNAAFLALRPFTIVRTRGMWLCQSDQVAASESFIGNQGHCVVSDQAVAGGVGVIPTPATERGSDLFFVHQSWVGGVDLVGTSWAADLTPQHYDSRAMRRVDDDSQVVVTVEAGLIGTGVLITNTFRRLIKLH